MRRRNFIAGLASTMVVWPLAARAQQTAEVPRVGFVYSGPKAVMAPRMEAILTGLQASGYAAPTQVEIVARTAEGDPDQIAPLVKEVIAKNVNVIIAAGPAVLQAARSATRTIPIIAIDLETDPVASGMAATLARPGGNITGVFLDFPDFTAKWMAQAVVLWNSDNQSKVVEWKDTEIAARTLGLTLRSIEVHAPEDFDGAFKAILREKPDALITFSESLTIAARQQIGRFALSNNLPMISELREFVVEGGLVSYGTSRSDLWRRSASYVDKIMRGANPGDLPVEQPTRFELVINLKTAKALGLTIPGTVLARTDEVIE